MKVTHEDDITQLVNAYLAAYTGKKSQLIRCIEIILGLKNHNQDGLLFNQVEPIQFLLGNPSSSFRLAPAEIPQVKALIIRLLTEAHQALVQKQLLTYDSTPDDADLLQLLSALNHRRLNHPIDDNDENNQPDRSSPSL